MLNIETIRKLIEEKISGSPQFLVDVKIRPGNKVILVMDSDTSFNIDDCVEMTRFFEAHFDREVEDYELEVSSAGLTTAFKHIRQYKKYLGKKIQVIQKDGIKRSGLLTVVTDSNITLEVKSTKKKEVTTTIETIEFNNIKESVPCIDFK